MWVAPTFLSVREQTGMSVPPVQLGGTDIPVGARTDERNPSTERMHFMRLMKSLGMIAILGMMPWAGVSAQVATPSVQAGSAEALTATTFAKYLKQIKPQPGESRWMDVPWFTDLHEARQKAAAEGKLLFIYSSGGSTAIGSC